MIEVNVDLDDKMLNSIKRKLEHLDGNADSVLKSVLDDVTAKIKADITEQTAGRYHITKGAIRKASKIKKSKSGAVVTVKGPVLSMTKFKVSPARPILKAKNRPDRLSAAVKRGGLKPVSADPKAFVAKMKSGHIGVFQRTGRWDSSVHPTRTRNFNRKRPGNSRRQKGEKEKTGHNEVITELFSPAVPWMVGNEEIILHMKSEAGNALMKRISYEIDRILQGGV
ncbi:MAG: hypothetical protein NC223_03155 [Butyrivibrio sp.]|nr:hypothetical protein [Butyrivibrio sp.]